MGKELSLNILEIARKVQKLEEAGGTTDYLDLSNKPQINGNTLTGNKTTSDLGINADNVMMSDDVTSVEQAVDRITQPGITAERVDISAFNTQSNPYTCPADGYDYGCRLRQKGRGTVFCYRKLCSV